MCRPTAWPSQYAEDRLRVSVSCQSASSSSSTGLRTLRPTACRNTCGRADQPGGLVDHGPARLGRAHVARRGVQVGAGVLGGARDPVEVLLVDVGEHDPRTLGGQAQRTGSAEAAGADHERRPSRQRKPVLHADYLSGRAFSYDESKFLPP